MMAYCDSCGNEIRETASFCTSCGGSVQTTVGPSKLTRKRVLTWGAIVIGGLVVVACLLVILGQIKRSESYQLVTQFASDNELIKAEIGEVTGFGFLPQGNVSTHSSAFSSSSGRQTTGEAAFLINVHGDTGKSELHINLIKSAGGDWQIVQAILVTDTGKQIDLFSLVPTN